MDILSSKLACLMLQSVTFTGSEKTHQLITEYGNYKSIICRKWTTYKSVIFYTTGACTIKHYGFLTYREQTYKVVSWCFFGYCQSLSLARTNTLAYDGVCSLETLSVQRMGILSNKLACFVTVSHFHRLGKTHQLTTQYGN